MFHVLARLESECEKRKRRVFVGHESLAEREQMYPEIVKYIIMYKRIVTNEQSSSSPTIASSVAERFVCSARYAAGASGTAAVK